MDLYTIFKFLHVLTAVAWVGGGLTLLASTLIGVGRKGDAGLFGTLEVMNGLGKVWFVPISFLTVVFGAVATTFGGMWDQAWVILGLLGFASTFFTGLLLIEPRGLKIGAMLQAGDAASAAAEGKRLMGVVKFDYVVMLVIVADMVFKPGWADLLWLGGFAAIVALGAAVFLLPALKPQAIAA